MMNMQCHSSLGLRKEKLETRKTAKPKLLFYSSTYTAEAFNSPLYNFFPHLPLRLTTRLRMAGLQL